MKTRIQSICVALCLIGLGAEAQTFHSMTPLSGFGPGGNGSMIVGDVPFVTVGAIQRGIAHNPVTGNLIFVDRVQAAQSANITGSIYVLNGTNGSVVTTLNTNGMQGGSFADYAISVANDGVVYVGNVIVNTAAGPFKIYRWDSDSTANASTVAFSGALGTNNFRWGNTIDVRGSGANTQIITASGGNEAAIFTTTDGINFTANVLKCDATWSLQGGVVFGTGDTFWAKFAGQPLRLMSFDLGAKTATTVREFGSPEMPDIESHEIADVDHANQILATFNPDGAAQDEIYLYGIGNPNDLPQLLDSYTVTSINNANSGSPRGYVSIGGGNVYVHSLNNGIFAFDLVDGAMPAPVILTQPAATRVLEGSEAVLRVVAQRGFTFQWRKGNASIPGETNSILIIPNVQLSDATNYSVVVGNSTDSITSSNALLTVLPLETAYQLTPLWSTAANAQPYFTTTGGASTTPNQRTVAYNSLSNHLYVVSRQSSSSANFTIWVVDAETGSPLYTLNTNGVNFTSFEGGIGLVPIKVADDGAIFAANVDVTTIGTGVSNWKLYRWADGGSNTVPQLVFTGDPLTTGASYRWGDAMDIRGIGVNMQIIIDNSSGNDPSTSHAAVLTPVDATMTNFVSLPLFLNNTNGGTSIARSLQFGSGNSFWQKRVNRPLVRSSFDPLAGPFQFAPEIEIFDTFASTIGAVTIDAQRNLLGAVNLTGTVGAEADVVDLYEITDLSTPVLLSRHSFPANKIANGGNFSQVVFGSDKVFALESQNGLAAFRLVIGSSIPPLLNVSKSGGDIVLTWEGTGFVLEAKTNFTSPTWSNVPYQAGSPNTATKAISESAKFYRLRK